MNNEQIEDLCLDGLQIIQNSNGYRFTSDSVILANYVKAKTNDKCLEIGTGCGVISILVAYKLKTSYIDAVEIQDELYDLAKRNFELNNMQCCHAIKGDIREFAKTSKTKYDVVFSNPPYFASNKIVVNNQRENCRSDINLSLKELCQSVKLLLKYSGKFFLVFDAERTSEVLTQLSLNGLEPKEMFFTQSAENINASLVVIKAVYGGKKGIKVLPVLITNDKNGDYIYTIQNTYRRL